MAFERIEHSGGAPTTALLGDIGSADVTLTLTDGTNWPTGIVGPFYLVIDPGTSSEEKMLATARSTNTLTGISRGVDGTTQFSHAAGAVIEHVWTAAEADEANITGRQTLGVVAAKGDLLVGSAAQTLVRQQVGADNRLLVADSSQTTGVRYGQATTAMIAPAAITPALLDASVVGAGLAGAAGTPLSVPVDGTTIDTAGPGLEVIANAITTTKLLDAAVTTPKIGDGQVTTAKIADGAVTAIKLASSALDSRPLGVVRFADRETTQNIGNAVEDFTSLSAFTLVAGRNYRVHGHIPQINVNGNGRVKVWIKDSSGAIYGQICDQDVASGNTTMCDGTIPINNASAGALTFKISAIFVSSSTMDLISGVAGSDQGWSYIELIDVGNQSI